MMEHFGQDMIGLKGSCGHVVTVLVPSSLSMAHIRTQYRRQKWPVSLISILLWLVTQSGDRRRQLMWLGLLFTNKFGYSMNPCGLLLERRLRKMFISTPSIHPCYGDGYGEIFMLLLNCEPRKCYWIAFRRSNVWCLSGKSTEPFGCVSPRWHAYYGLKFSQGFCPFVTAPLLTP